MALLCSVSVARYRIQGGSLAHTCVEDVHLLGLPCVRFSVLLSLLLYCTPHGINSYPGGPRNLARHPPHGLVPNHTRFPLAIHTRDAARARSHDRIQLGRHRWGGRRLANVEQPRISARHVWNRYSSRYRASWRYETGKASGRNERHRISCPVGHECHADSDPSGFSHAQ